jgi:hypothetical protein
VKNAAKFVLRPCVRLVDAFPALRRSSAFLARKAGVYAPLHSIYRRLSCRRNGRTELNLGLIHTDGGGKSESLSPPESVTIDKLLSRIHAELARAQEEGKRQ